MKTNEVGYATKMQILEFKLKYLNKEHSDIIDKALYGCGCSKIRNNKTRLKNLNKLLEIEAYREHYDEIINIKEQCEAELKGGNYEKN